MPKKANATRLTYWAACSDPHEEMSGAAAAGTTMFATGGMNQPPLICSSAIDPVNHR